MKYIAYDTHDYFVTDTNDVNYAFAVLHSESWDKVTIKPFAKELQDILNESHNQVFA